LLGITTSGISTNNVNLFHELKNNNIFIIDCSLTNLLTKDWAYITEYDIEKLSDDLEKNSIQINSIQSIFYNKKLNFSNNLDLNKIISHLEMLCKYAKILKCKKLLFGSPIQRKDINKFDVFVKTFIDINNLMNDNDMIFNIENLDYQNDVLLQMPLQIINFIETNFLNNCKLNLHLFVENKNIDFELLKNNIVDTIHFSNYNYSDNIFDNDFYSLQTLIKFTKNNNCNKILEFNTKNFKLKNVNKLFALL